MNQKQIMEAIQRHHDSNTALKDSHNGLYFENTVPDDTVMPYIEASIEGENTEMIKSDFPIDSILVQFSFYSSKRAPSELMGIHNSFLEHFAKNPTLSLATENFISMIRRTGVGPYYDEDDESWYKTQNYEVVTQKT